ncbi:SDR family oxidoreductase [Chitinophaga filiformis]|uniref:SDR family oxidoreductase n=1 Tax=Chitinophaga filiformis TaxID=104663 RepID=A0ABY4I0E4_CHIFI|nr:SDR family oxidoreductase [Chitinophaga filiformis]UPK68759.1 SDR family oxidoreductase [Chitinophaga filiformis]
MNFEHKVVWIIGASSGIGLGLVKAFAAQKARLIISSRDSAALTAVAEQLEGHTTCTVLPADMTDHPGLAQIAEHAISAYGHIDIVIHSAGVGQRSAAIDTQLPVYRRLMELNFFGPLTLTQHLLPHFRKQGHGHVVAVSSMSGLMGFPLRSGYVASKHALKGYFETLQVEHTLDNFYVTIVSPGRIKTGLSLSALTGNGTPYDKMDKGQLHGIPVNECAHRILKAISKKKKHVIIARSERLLYWLRMLIPPAYYRIARKRGLADQQ